MTKRGPRVRLIPQGDTHERLVCPECDFVNYQNPRLVVGSVVRAGDDRVLLCRRNIDPRSGYWTLPAGYMELGESPAEGAVREAREEALASIRIRDVLGIYALRHIGQVQIIHRADLLIPEEGPAYGVGEETLEVRLFTEAEIPWRTLAFPTVSWALKQYFESRDQLTLAPFGNREGDTGNLEGWTPEQNG